MNIHPPPPNYRARNGPVSPTRTDLTSYSSSFGIDHWTSKPKVAGSIPNAFKQTSQLARCILSHSETASQTHILSYCNYYLNFQEILANQELSAADVQRIKQRSGELKKTLSKLEEASDSLDQEIWEKEMSYARRHEQVLYSK